MQEVKITRADNGYIMSFDSGIGSNGSIDIHKEIIKVNDKDVFDNQSMKELLEWIAFFFGCTYNKMRTDNLSITFDKS